MHNRAICVQPSGILHYHKETVMFIIIMIRCTGWSLQVSHPWKKVLSLKDSFIVHFHKQPAKSIHTNLPMICFSKLELEISYLWLTTVTVSLARLRPRILAAPSKLMNTVPNPGKWKTRLVSKSIPEEKRTPIEFYQPMNAPILITAFTLHTAPGIDR